MYQSTKVYDHNLGLSVCYRQWRAKSHCRLLHGYALAFKFVFESDKLDERNWVVDFGDLDQLRNALKIQFDHTTLVAQDDPQREKFEKLYDIGLIRLRLMPDVGCEAFAELAYAMAEETCKHNFPHVRVVSAEVSEHGANSAIYLGAT